MMGLLFLIGVGLVIYLIVRHPRRNSSVDINAQLEARNLEWAQFIANYRGSAKTKAEKAIVEKMLADIESKGLPVPPNPDKFDSYYQTVSSSTSAATSSGGNTEAVSRQLPDASVSQSTDIAKSKSKAQIQLDNASLLLYFGAFLFVASTGLFVVFGGVSGSIRCLIVLLVMAVLYGGGIWLYRNKPKFEQAGLAFAGIGMAIAPLVGLAAYNYLFNQSNGQMVWFGTSVLCLVMYAHALVTLRKPLINYIFIFTFLSLFESGVSIINAPIYYFGWMLAFVGILLTFVNRIKGFWPDMQESSRVSSMLFVPMSVLVSIVLVSSHGASQLGVSLVLAAAYYGLEVLSSTGVARQNNALAAQIALNGAVASLAYGTSQSWLTVGISLTILNVAQVLLVALQSKTGELYQNLASVALVSQILAIISGIQHPVFMLWSTVALVVLSIIVWLRQKRNDAYALAALSSLAIPVIFGELISTPRIANSQLVLMLTMTLIAQFLAVMTLPIKLWNNKLDVPSQIYLISLLSVVVTTFLVPMWLAVMICTILALSSALLIEHNKDSQWAAVVGLVIAVPLLRGWDVPGAFLATALIATALNIFLALRHRMEANRWFSTALWLILPLAFGSGILGVQWGYAAFAWAYLAAMLGLVVSRAIARGVLLVSNTVPLASYARTASMSYVVGYCLAITASVVLSLLAPNSQLTTSIILGIVAVVIWVLSELIEKQADLLALLPLVLQGILWSAIRPTLINGYMESYLLISTLLAAACYFIPDTIKAPEEKAKYIQIGSLIAAFITPFSIFFVGQTLWTMPVGLLVAGGLVYYQLRDTSQQNRELAGGLITAGVMWLMYFAGIREIQAYMHVLVALSVGYAYWRHSRGETKQSDQYIQIALLAATVPLAFQALGSAGGLYGWWLLIEQVFIMIIGMAIGKRFVTLWGLYVAIGAVLYQLRNLGWAALTVLALFLIGMAVYKIQKYNEK